MSKYSSDYDRASYADIERVTVRVGGEKGTIYASRRYFHEAQKVVKDNRLTGATIIAEYSNGKRLVLA